jgi:hypothetical protein
MYEGTDGQTEGWLNELGLYKLLDPTTYHQYGVGSRPAL